MPGPLPKHRNTARAIEAAVYLYCLRLPGTPVPNVASLRGKKITFEVWSLLDAHCFCTLVKSKYHKLNSGKYSECLFTLDPDSPEVSVSHNHSTIIKVNNLTTTLS